MRHYRDLLALDERDGPWAVLIASEVDIAFIEALPSGPLPSSVSPSGLKLQRKPSLDHLIVETPTDWPRYAISMKDLENPEYVFQADAIVCPPKVSVDPARGQRGELELDNRFEPVRRHFYPFRAINELTGDQYTFYVEAAPEFEEPDDVLLNWPDISEIVMTERIKLESEITDQRKEYPAVGRIHDWRPPDYALTVADTKRRLRMARVEFENAYLLVEKACQSAATRASLSGFGEASSKLMEALNALRSLATHRERLAHRLGKYGQMAQSLENEWNSFNYSRSARKGNAAKRAAGSGLDIFDSRVREAVKEIISARPGERVMISKVALRLAGSSAKCNEAFKKKVSRAIDRLIEQERLSAESFLRKSDT